MNSLDATARVSKQRRCPIYRRPDWCLIFREGGDDPDFAVCAREESKYRSDLLARLWLCHGAMCLQISPALGLGRRS